ncbi:MAG: type II secretion system protein [Phycisphaerales bacterium]|jgi:prepilin-type N-terminal cleavage/methylation domain-containing protein|nr:type II secretion system protein [Phycisphaerales bacterium]
MTRAFTILEMMAVVAILGVLAALVLVGVQRLDASSMSAADLARQRQIAAAQTKYAADHDSRLLHPRTTVWDSPNPYVDLVNSQDGYDVELRDADNLYQDALSRFWVRDFGDGLEDTGETDPVTGQPLYIEVPDALSSGAAWDYLDANIDAYRSPLDPSTRIRSYSLNGFVGVNVCAEDWYWSEGGPFEGDFIKYAVPCPTSMQIRQPSMTMCSIAEDDPSAANNTPGFNQDGFLVHPDQDTAYWYDIPALWDPTRINLSNMDGSTHSIRVSDPDLYKTLAQPDSGPGYLEHACPEILQIQQRLLPGVLEFRTLEDLPD